MFRCLVFLLFLACSLKAAQPNIVLILADDMGYETVGAYGGESYDTPNIDRLASEGLRFDHAYSQPLCTPTRVQIMTGKYNAHNYDVFEKLPKGQTTFGNVLRDAGYKTFMGGKWQLSQSVAGSFQDPIDFGFDEYYLWQLDRHPKRYYAPGFEANIPAQGWYKERVNYPASAETFGPDLVVNQINAFIERNQDEPFFVYYAMMLPHNPFLPTPDHPDFDPTATSEPDDPIYFEAMAEYTDKMVGRILDQLDALGLADNTLVIFCGDNGTKDNVTSILNGEPVQGGKGQTTDAGTHIPFIVRWPNEVTAGETTEVLADFSDILPTIAEAGGTTPPSNIDGHSLLPELLERSGTDREWSYCWYKPRNDNENEVSEYARTKRYRLYRSGEFYDIQEDVLEQSPLDTSALNSEEQAAYDSLQVALSSFNSVVADRDEAPRFSSEPWESEPHLGANPGIVYMEANEPEDQNGPVEYQFANNTKGTSSTWTFDTTYTESNIDEDADYEYRYRTRDLLGNVSDWSTISTVTVYAAVNPLKQAVNQSSTNGDSGAANLGQSFTIPEDKDGTILASIDFYYSAGKGGGSAWYLSIYEGYTDRTTRGTRIATSINEVTAPSTDGATLRWDFGNLVLKSGQTYYAVVSDSDGQPLASGAGVPAKRDSNNPYASGQRLNESGADDIDLKFAINYWQSPRTFNQWLIKEALPSNTGFDELDSFSGQAYAIRYCFDLGQDGSLTSDLPRLNSNWDFSFTIRQGIDDINWLIRYTEDLTEPYANWQSKAPGSGDVDINYSTGEVVVRFDGLSHIFATVEITQL